MRQRLNGGLSRDHGTIERSSKYQDISARCCLQQERDGRRRLFAAFGRPGTLQRCAEHAFGEARGAGEPLAIRAAAAVQPSLPPHRHLPPLACNRRHAGCRHILPPCRPHSSTPQCKPCCARWRCVRPTQLQNRCPCWRPCRWQHRQTSCCCCGQRRAAFLQRSEQRCWVLWRGCPVTSPALACWRCWQQTQAAQRRRCRPARQACSRLAQPSPGPQCLLMQPQRQQPSSGSSVRQQQQQQRQQQWMRQGSSRQRSPRSVLEATPRRRAAPPSGSARQRATRWALPLPSSSARWRHTPLAAPR